MKRTRLVLVPLAAILALPWVSGCGGGGGTSGGSGAAPAVPGSTPSTDRPPSISKASLTLASAAGGAGGTVQGTQIRLPVGGGTIEVTMTVADPEGSVPVVTISVFNNNTGQLTTVTLTSPVGGGVTYTGLINIPGNRGADGLAVTYLLTATATDAAQSSSTAQLGTVLVPAASQPPVPPPPNEL